MHSSQDSSRIAKFYIFDSRYSKSSLRSLIVQPSIYNYRSTLDLHAQQCSVMLRSIQHTRSSVQLARSQLCQQLLSRYSAATGNVVELSSDEHIETILAADKVSVLDFTAKWCGPCKIMAPEYAKMSGEFPKASFFKIDIDNPDVQTSVSNHEITGVPTFKLVRKGSVLAEMTGADKSTLRKYLQQHAQ